MCGFLPNTGCVGFVDAGVWTDLQLASHFPIILQNVTNDDSGDGNLMWSSSQMMKFSTV